MISAHYKAILARNHDAIENLVADIEHLPAFTAAHNSVTDLDSLGRLVLGRPEEPMFELARLEYQHALFSASVAHYRQANVSLRLFFELSLGCILFSAHEIDARLWLKDKKDINWQAIVSKENGVFSKHFSGAFFEEMKEHCAQYGAMAEQVYRECSEYVHGNRKSFNGIDGEIAFNSENIGNWTDRADTARLVVAFAFLNRYMRDASQANKDELENMMLENFGTLPPVQYLYEKAPE